MEKKKKTIIVPWDFTDIANYALGHAVKLAKITGDDITILHIIKKNENAEELTQRMKKTAKDNTNNFGIETKILVQEGSIFNTISDTAEDMDAEMVIMGTHGVKGVQKFLGSWALKVITNSKIPFVVVQAPPKDEIFQNILFPLNFKKENKETISWVIYLSKLYRTKIHILAAKYTDKKLKNGVNSNIIFAKHIFAKKGINFDINYAEGKTDFSKELVNYAKKISAGVILIMTTRDLTLADFLLGAFEQSIISNSAKIPVMCLNPKPLKNVGGFLAGGG